MERDLSGRDLSGQDLSGQDLSGVNFRGTDLKDANLQSANLNNADLTDADLSDANLSRASLCYAILNGAILPNANLSHADLSNATLRNASLFGADLHCADLTGANLYRTFMPDGRFHEEHLELDAHEDPARRPSSLSLLDAAEMTNDPLRIVTGKKGTDSFETLYRMTGPPTEDDIGYRLMWWFFLRREVGFRNPNAIAVYAKNGDPDEKEVLGQVGVLPTDLTNILAPVLDADTERSAITVEGIVIGGFSVENPEFNVYLYLNQLDITGGLGLDPEVLAGFSVPVDLDHKGIPHRRGRK